MIKEDDEEWVHRKREKPFIKSKDLCKKVTCKGKVHNYKLLNVKYVIQVLIIYVITKCCFDID